MILYHYKMVYYCVYIHIFYDLGIVLYYLLTKNWIKDPILFDQMKKNLNYTKMMTVQRDNKMGFQNF